jgi:acetyl esterase/lipase
MSSSPHSTSSFFSHPLSTTLKKAFVSLPRLVPHAVLHITSPDGPHPFIVKLPARDPSTHEIPVHVFVYVPPLEASPTAPTIAKVGTDRLAPGKPEKRSSSRSRREKKASKKLEEETIPFGPGSGTNEPIHTSKPAKPKAKEEEMPFGPGSGTAEPNAHLRRLQSEGLVSDNDAASIYSTTPTLTLTTDSVENASTLNFSDDTPTTPPSGNTLNRAPTASSVYSNVTTATNFSSGSSRTLSHQPTRIATTSTGQHVTSLDLPVIIDFHGGSFILGTPQEQAPFCSFLARSLGSQGASFGSGCVVLSVDYRLGPYSQYPAANLDAEDVVNAVLKESSAGGTLLRERIREEISNLGRTEWVTLDTSKIALSGFSSGGNLALTLAMNSYDDPTLAELNEMTEGPLYLEKLAVLASTKNGKDWLSIFPADHPYDIPLLLFYPSFDSRLLPDERPRPPGLNPPMGLLTRWKIESELMPKYLPAHQRAHPRASPGLGPVNNGGLHPRAKVWVLLPELDSLSEQSIHWVHKVYEEGRGRDLEVVAVPGVMHGWTQFPDSFLKTDEERRKKVEAFDGARRFLERFWG